ncbi:MAG: hypothetical protein HYY01_11240 [Chloroflexi bacterium]|nr:hypothetical protein [Chloroflexota bacterium]
MVNQHHRLAEEALESADLAMREGRRDEARRHYALAARSEVEALKYVAPENPRTKGILAVSAVSCYYKAELEREAELVACQLLPDPTLPEFARSQIEELLQVIWENRRIGKAAADTEGKMVEVVLRGKEVRQGLAPVDLIIDRFQGVQSLSLRIVEWLGGFALRFRGPAPKAVQMVCKPYVTQPMAGSYRFGVYFEEPLQLELIPRSVKPRDIADSMLNIAAALGTVERGDFRNAAIEDVIPRQDYRDVILKLLRNMIPDGRRVTSVEFAKMTTAGLQRVVFYSGVMDRIKHSLSAVHYPGTGESVEFRGVLRGAHLDLLWIDIGVGTGDRLRWKIEHELYDDVVGPLMNRPVIVRGVKRDGEHILLDIEPDFSVEAEGQG